MKLLLAVLIITYSQYISANEVKLFDSDESVPYNWQSTQNDADPDLGSYRWNHVGNSVSFYVCRIQGNKQDNFLRTPFIPIPKDIAIVYVEVKYILNPCTQSRENVSRDNCQQFFYLHKKESNSSNDKSIVNEYTYPVATEHSIVPGEFDTEITTDPLPVHVTGENKGIYFALRDRGACMTMLHFVVKYRLCPEMIKNAVKYNETILADKDLPVTGTCVENASHPVNDPPVRYCWSDGRSWEAEFQKSDCFCNQGYELKDDVCIECELGFYKKKNGNKEGCIKCPTHSMSLLGYTFRCDCIEGFQRADESDVDQGCISPPESPKREEIKMLNMTSSSFSWSVPQLDQGLKYKVVVSKKVDNSLIDIKANTVLSNTSLTIADLEPEQEYMIKLIVHNGSVESDKTMFIETTKAERKTIHINYIIAIGVLACIIVVFVIFVTAVCVKKRKSRKSKRYSGYGDCRDPMLEHGKIGTISTHSGSLQHRQYVPISKYANEQEALKNAINIDSSQIKLDRKFGQGQFGEVWKGTYHPPGSKPKEVAAKLLRDGATLNEKRDFLAEASIMVQFEHPNVIELLGIVGHGDQTMIITEFMRNGSLKDYLKEIRGKVNIIELLSMARGIVSGMQYLADMNFIHRDLAARNILVDERNVCKVADFGLSRMLEVDALYFRPQGGQIPVRWTAPEAIQHRKYTQKSDVYSFGVVLWEILTYGDEPWGRQVTNDMVLEYLRDQMKLQKPDDCPNDVYGIMMSCWQEDTRRPTFAQLHATFDELILTFVDDRPTTRTLPMESTLADIVSEQEQISTVQQWLEQMSMSRYQSHFINTGWDSMDKVLLMTTEDLRNIGITLAGHQKKIITAIDYIRNFSNTFPQYVSGSPSNNGTNTLPTT